MPNIPAPPPANTPVEWVVIVLALLIVAIFSGLVSIVVYYVRTIAPRAVTESARQTQAIDNNTAAIQMLTTALDGLKTSTHESVSALERNVNARLDTLHRDLTGAVHDEKMNRLVQAVSRKNGAADEEAPLSRRSPA